MPLSAGAILGHYEISSRLGRGGMGEVWKARDPKLGRDVAIKVSAQQFTDRFEREARAIAALNHPNVCTLYHVGPDYLVMEYIEGPTLAERIREGPMPLDEALGVARQIADALEAAHGKNIVHRDLKPANIKIRPDGSVKVLDFGLAKMGEAQEIAPDSPTMPGTQIGMILGTAAYMSPEQAAGKVADNRSDVWSFGVVFWEMITGAKLFDSETVSHTLADVLRSPIDFTKIPGSTPSAILELLKRCLDRDVKTRLQAIGEARIAIVKYLSGPRTAIQVPQTKTGNLSKGVWVVSAVLAIVAAALAVAIWAPWRPAPDAAKPVRFQIAPPAGVNAVGAFSLSPDGTKLVYFGSGSDGALRLWVRAMDTLESRPLMGTEGVSNAPVFWSPDSQFIAFSAEGKLKKIDATGSPPETICDVPGTGTVLGGSWNRGGVIVFGLNNASGIQRVSSAGGAPLAVTAVNARQPSIHLAPVFLPDGRHFLYLVNSSPEDSGIYIGSIDSRPDHQNPKRLVATTFGAAFVSSPAGNRGTILFDREGTLLAQQFDPGRLETIGELVQVAEGLGSFLGFGYFSASNQGTLAYRGGANGADMQLTWFDRQGKNLGVVGTRHDYRDLSLSPDGTRVAAARAVGNNRDIWLTALSRGSETRFTFDPGLDLYPIWSSDGSQIVFSSNRSGSFDLYYHAANGSGKDELLLKSDHNKAPTDFSADGRFLLYDDLDPKTKRDLWVLPMEGAPDVRKPVSFLRTGFNEQNAKFSPDRHWVAYQSDQSGRFEIYVRPFPEAGGGEWLVSQGGGTQPRWRADDRELFYLARDGKVMAVPVAASGATLQPGVPAVLFRGPPNPAGWDTSSDGKRFLFPLPADNTQTPFTIVQNWMPLLRK